MEEKNCVFDNNPLLNLVYINLCFSELIEKADNCLKTIDEKEPEKFIKKFHSNMENVLKIYDEQILKIKNTEGKIALNNEKEKIKYIKSKGTFFKKNSSINEQLLIQFITENILKIIMNNLTSNEIIIKYLSSKIIAHIKETINFYNLIIKKDMEEIKKNKNVISQGILEVMTIEKKEKTEKEKNLKLNSQINNLKKDIDNKIIYYENEIDDIKKKDKELINKLKEDNNKLCEQILKKKKELKEQKINLNNWEEKYKQICISNSMLISNQCINENLFDDYIGKVQHLNERINELNKEIKNIKSENSDLKNKYATLLQENKELKNQIKILVQENSEIKDNYAAVLKENAQIKDNYAVILKENNELKNKCETVLKANAELKNKYETILKENAELKNQIKILVEENGDLKNKIQELSGINDVLFMKIEKQSSEIYNLKAIIEINRLNSEKKYEELEKKFMNLSANINKSK